MKKVALLVVLLVLLSSGSPAEAWLPKPPQESLLEEPVPGCQWFWVRDVETSHTGWYAINTDGEPDVHTPVKCLKYLNGEFLFPDIPLETFQDPENPPQIVEVVYLPYRLGDIGGHHGIELKPIGHWEWSCG